MQKKSDNILQLNAKAVPEQTKSLIAEVTEVKNGLATEVLSQQQTLAVDHCVHGQRELCVGDEVLVQCVSERTLVTHRIPKADEPCEPQLSHNGDQWVLSSDTAVKLKIGKANLELQPNGDVAIEGRDLLSEATGINRLLGGRIELN